MRPRLVEQGRPTQLRIELPQLRAGAPPVRLEVEGAGVTVLSSNPQGAFGTETLWSVRLRVSPATPPGELLLVLRGFFADGKSVEVDANIVVVPPAAQPAGAFPWLWVAIGVPLALLLAVGALVVARRRN